MASFEVVDGHEPWKAYRPDRPPKDQPRAWWKYFILAERHKVREQRRLDIWKCAGNKGMHLLAHLRALIANNGSTHNVDLSELSETYLDDSAEKLTALEATVDDLECENMTLRKLLKSLLTPAAKEDLPNDPLMVQYIESQLARFDHYTKFDSPKKGSSPVHVPSPHSKRASPLLPSGVAGNADEGGLLSSIMQSIALTHIIPPSPHDKDVKALPAMHPTQTTSGTDKQGQQKKSAWKKNAGRPGNDGALSRRPVQTATRAPINKAPRATRASVDNEGTVTALLPVLPLKAKASPPLATHFPATNSPTPSAATVTPTLTETDSLPDTVSLGSRASQIRRKAPKHPPWVDDVKIIDPLIGRGRGRPKEVCDDSSVGSHGAGRVKQGAKGPTSRLQSVGVSAENSVCTEASGLLTLASEQTMAEALVYLVPTPDMTEAEKLAIQIIAKARGASPSPEMAKKPLTRSEIALLNSPLAVPLVTPRPGDLDLSPREKTKAFRDKVKPVVDSHNHNHYISHNKNHSPGAGTEKSGDAHTGASGGTRVVRGGGLASKPVVGGPRSPQKGVAQNRSLSVADAQNQDSEPPVTRDDDQTVIRTGIQETVSPEPIPAASSAGIIALHSPASSPITSATPIAGTNSDAPIVVRVGKALDEDVERAPRVAQKAARENKLVSKTSAATTRRHWDAVPTETGPGKPKKGVVPVHGPSGPAHPVDAMPRVDPPSNSTGAGGPAGARLVKGGKPPSKPSSGSPRSPQKAPAAANRTVREAKAEKQSSGHSPAAATAIAAAAMDSARRPQCDAATVDSTEAVRESTLVGGAEPLPPLSPTRSPGSRDPTSAQSKKKSILKALNGKAQTLSSPLRVGGAGAGLEGGEGSSQAGDQQSAAREEQRPTESPTKPPPAASGLFSIFGKYSST